jgi:hypothetical protein
VRLAAEAPLVYTPQLWASFRLHGAAKTIAADQYCWDDMLRVHRRLGGSPLAPIVWKYWLRKLAAPLLAWRKRRMMRSGGSS